MGKKYVSWRRVSTGKQARSGLGLEAQRDIIDFFVEREGGELIADYSECYTGKDLQGCVELQKAMHRAKEEGAILIIAKSDRFRNCQEALGILDKMGEGNVEFCDIPHTDRFTLTLFFALAEREALIVSIRTKQALAVKKAQGCKLGAANAKYKRNYKKKSQEQKEEEIMKRGITKNLRRLESKDTQAMIRILKKVFPNATCGDNPSEWDWSCIGTKGDAKTRMLQLMQDYKEMDESGATFRNWEFGSQVDGRRQQQKLAAYLQSIRKSVYYSNNN